MLKNLCILMPFAIVEVVAMKLGWYFTAGLVFGFTYYAGVYFGEKV